MTDVAEEIDTDEDDEQENKQYAGPASANVAAPAYKKGTTSGTSAAPRFKGSSAGKVRRAQVRCVVRMPEIVRITFDVPMIVFFRI